MSPVRESSLRRKLRATGLAVFGFLVLVYPIDWAVWHLRQLAGGGMDSVAVTNTTAATLKGNRFEVYSQNTLSVDCSRSLLPEAGAGACWWLRRHPQIITQY